MAQTVGRAFKIKKSQAKGYGYAKPGFRSNPGVTTIAAINGRGSYRRRGRPVVIATKGLSKNARRARARKALSSAERKAFALRMAQARKGGKRRLGRNASKRVVLKSRKSRASKSRRKSGVTAATRKTPMKRKRKARKAITKRRRKSSKRRASTKRTVTRKRKTRKGKRRAKASSKKLRRNKRRKATTKRKSSRKRRSRKASAAAPKRRRRKAGKRKARKTKRKGSKKRKSKSSKRSRAARKAARTRKRNASAKLKPNRRRKHRKNRRSKRRVSRRKSYASNRRRSSSRKSHRKNRRHRRNGRRRSAFMRNGKIGDVLKTGLVLFAGFGGHRIVSNLLAQNVLSRVFGSATTPAATSGLESLQPYTGAISSIITGVGLGFIANASIKDESTKKLVVGGIALSALHGVAMSLFQSFMPKVAGMLAGPEDGTAARISAMYGLRGGESIQPRYAAIGRGMGEYFAQPMSGMGEYFAQPMGEYIAASGLGSTYEPAGYEAAAGVGVVEVPGNHIDPSSDLDRQLTIAEAAAGVGAIAPFEAAAGLQPFEASAGMGAISRVGSESTWIPGTSDGQLWAGVRAVNQGQGANEMVPAGVLETPGGQGIFG